MAPEEQPQRLARIGEACALALAGAAICALPTALRVQSGGGGFVDALVASMAVLLCLLVPLALLLPRAWRGWRGVVGQQTPRRLVIGIGIWIGTSALVLTLLGSWLKASTNHRGLGGAAFGVIGAGAVCVCAVVAARAVAIGERLEAAGWSRTLLRAAGGLFVAAPLAVVALPFLRVDGTPGWGSARASVFDLLVLVAVVALLLSRKAPESLATPIRIGALPIALCLVVVGFVRIETAGAAPAIQRGGGLVAAALDGLEAWTDRDGDGVGAHFGGRDCDEGDPRRNPRATDLQGDGVDSNCDGADGLLADLRATPVEPLPAASAADADASAATVVAHAPAEPKAAPPSDRPDIILVTLDSVRADRCSAYGHTRDTTPTLQALAERGTMFEHAYAVGSTTQRAIVPLVSAMSLSATPHTTKEWPLLREEALMVAERLKAVGYATAAVSSFTWIRKDRGFGQGFDELDESSWSERHPEREVTADLAIKAARRLYEKMARGNAPLFLWVHLFDAHAKYVEHPGIEYGKEPIDLYDGEITFVDRELRKLLEAVDKGARAGRTVWMVHGSHGEAFGEHDQSGHGTQLYEESIRVPLIIAAPGKSAARWDKPVSTLDIAPTILHYAEASHEGIQGVSLRPALDGTAFARDPVISYAHRRVAVIELPYKLHVFRRGDRKNRLLLFDLSLDPGETKDISGDKKDVLERLAAVPLEPPAADD